MTQPTPLAQFDAQAEQKFRVLVGAKYAGCRLSNFDLGEDNYTKSRTNTVDMLRRFCRSIPEHVDAGVNVIFNGPCGTGKDHLMTACLRVAVANGFSCHYTSGADLFSHSRSRFDIGDTEEDFMETYIKPMVLAISDIAPPVNQGDDSTKHERRTLYQIIDRRYRMQRGTWVTVNLKTREDMEDLLSEQVYSRLTDNAVRVPCFWPDYRASRRVEI